MNYRSIGITEFISIPKGLEATDAMLKAAAVELLQAVVLCPGKLISIVGGEVSAVQSSIEAARQVADDALVDSDVFPNIHPSVFPALAGATAKKALNALGVIETFTASSAILAADAAAKAAAVQLLEIRMARGMAGKTYVIMTGDLADVRAAVDAGVASIKTEGALIGYSVIPSPHPELWEKYV